MRSPETSCVSSTAWPRGSSVELFYLKVAFLHCLTGAPVGHSVAAQHAQTPAVPAAQLLTQAWRESRHTGEVPGQVTVSVPGRHRGVWRGGRFPWRGPYYCGALQLRRTTERACRRVDASLALSYRGAVEHLGAWRDYCMHKHPGSDLRVCALAGYAGGVRGAAIDGRARRYARSVLRAAARVLVTPGGRP